MYESEIHPCIILDYQILSFQFTENVPSGVVGIKNQMSGGTAFFEA